MAKKVYPAIDGKARTAKKMYLGVNGVARKVKKGYLGVNGVARQFFSSGYGPTIPGAYAVPYDPQANFIQRFDPETTTVLSSVTSALVPTNTSRGRVRYQDIPWACVGASGQLMLEVQKISQSGEDAIIKTRVGSVNGDTGALIAIFEENATRMTLAGGVSNYILTRNFGTNVTSKIDLNFRDPETYALVKTGTLTYPSAPRNTTQPSIGGGETRIYASVNIRKTSSVNYVGFTIFDVNTLASMNQQVQTAVQENYGSITQTDDGASVIYMYTRNSYDSSSSFLFNRYFKFDKNSLAQLNAQSVHNSGYGSACIVK